MTDLAPTVRSTVTVDLPVAHAFTIFTTDMARWWPAEHHVLDGPLAEMIVEPRVGGHIFDRGVDGTECRWARVVAYEPPVRFAFSWDISTDWKVETDPEHCSEVEVTFTEEGPSRTRVSLEHRYLERHGEGWEGMMQSVSDPRGWPFVMESYAQGVAVERAR